MMMNKLRKVKKTKPSFFTRIFDGVEKTAKFVKRHRKLPLFPKDGGKEGYIPHERKTRRAK